MWWHQLRPPPRHLRLVAARWHATLHVPTLAPLADNHLIHEVHAGVVVVVGIHFALIFAQKETKDIRAPIVLTLAVTITFITTAVTRSLDTVR